MDIVGRKEGLQELREKSCYGTHRTFLVIKHCLLDVCPETKMVSSITRPEKKINVCRNTIDTGDSVSNFYLQKKTNNPHFSMMNSTT